jgi:hypothetical protein
MTDYSSYEGALIFVAIFALILVRRMYALTQGTPYSTVRVFGYAGFSVAVFILLGATTFYVAIGTWGWGALGLLAPYAAVVVGSTLLVEPHIGRVVEFEERADGETYYRLPILIPLLSTILFIVRVGAELVLLGPNALFAFSQPSAVSPGLVALLVAIDLLYGVSVGLLIGRAIGVHRAFQARTPAAAKPLPA